MKNHRINLVLIFCFGLNIYAQEPNWSVNENEFQYTMSFISFLNVDGRTLSKKNDKVAAFINNECRGIANLVYVPSKESYFAYLTVFSNENNEEITFKIYDSENDVVTKVEKSENFQINSHRGTLFQPQSFATPALNNQANIIDIGFNTATVKNKKIDGAEYSVDVNNSIDVSAMNMLFELSKGAKLFIGTEQQFSGNNSIDFRQQVYFQVLSEDHSVLKQWKVNVNQSTGTITYYIKDAVCYQGGAIKVLFGEDNVNVELSENGVVIATQTITNGNTVFDNLEKGTYIILVGGNTKEIGIKLKE